MTQYEQMARHEPEKLNNLLETNPKEYERIEAEYLKVKSSSHISLYKKYDELEPEQS